MGTEKETERAFKRYKRKNDQEEEAYQHKKFRKTSKPSIIFDKAFRMFLFTTVMFSALKGGEAKANPDINQIMADQDHYVIFDKVGEMASHMAYIHVTLAVNITNLYDRAEVLNTFITDNIKNIQVQKELNRTVVMLMPDKSSYWVSHNEKQGNRAVGGLFKSIFQIALNKLDLVMADLASLIKQFPNDENKEPETPERIQKILSNKRFKTAKPETVFQGGNEAKRGKRHIRTPRTTTTTRSTTTPAPPMIPMTKFVSVDQEYTDIRGSNMESFFTKLTNGVEHREKRFAPLLFAAGGFLLGTFLGLFNKNEINNLAKQMSDLKTTSNVLVQVTNQHEVQLNILQQEVTSLTHLLEDLVRHSPEVLEASLDFAIMELKVQVDKVKATFQMLQFHRLSTDLMSGLELREMHNRITIMATENNYRLLPEIPSDYFQLETSYMRERDNLMVIIHVPCIAKEHALTIYQFVPYPFPLPNLVEDERNTTIAEIFDPDLKQRVQRKPIQRKREALYIQTETQFLAIGRKQQYKLLSDAEFGLCNKKSNFYLCEEHQVVKTKLTDTCIGSLYARSLEGVNNHCQFERKILQESVFQFSPIEYLIYSPENFNTEITCRNGSHFPLHIHEEHLRVFVPQGCEAKLQSHVITSDVTLRINPNPLQVKWKWNPLTLPSNLLDDVGMMDEQLGRLERHIEYMRNFTLDPKHIRPIAESLLVERHMFSWVWYVVLGIICTLIVLIIIGCIVTFLRRHRLITLCNILGRRTPTPPPEAVALQEMPIIQHQVHRQHDCTPTPRRSSRPKSFAGSYTSLTRRGRGSRLSLVNPDDPFDLPVGEPWGYYPEDNPERVEG